MSASASARKRGNCPSKWRTPARSCHNSIASESLPRAATTKAGASLRQIRVASGRAAGTPSLDSKTASSLANAVAPRVFSIRIARTWGGVKRLMTVDVGTVSRNPRILKYSAVAPCVSGSWPSRSIDQRKASPLRLQRRHHACGPSGSLGHTTKRSSPLQSAHGPWYSPPFVAPVRRRLVQPLNTASRSCEALNCWIASRSSSLWKTSAAYQFCGIPLHCSVHCCLLP